MVSEKGRIAGAVVLLVLAVVSIVTLAGTYWTQNKRTQTATFITLDLTDEAGKPETTAETTCTSAETVPVYLVGAVSTPGIYHVPAGIYLYELIEQAGGLSADAAEDRINLVYCIRESRLLRIPTVEEIQQEGAKEEGLEGVVEMPGQLGEAEGSGQVDINSASEAELDTLPGIGPATARAIIDYRDKNGLFASIDEIMKVPGIKESRFEALREQITAG